MSPAAAARPELERLREAIHGSSLNQGLLLLGDRWTLSILRAAFLGTRQFEQFRAQLDIPRQTLSQRLKQLVQAGILSGQPYQLKPLRHAYRLTPKGLALYPNVLMSWAWERKWRLGNEQLPRKLLHLACGQRFLPRCVCAQCRETVGSRDVLFRLGRAGPQDQAQGRSRRWSGRLPVPGPAAAGGELALGLSVDRWALMIVASVLLGCRQFDALQQVLSVGSSVLARRLAMLCDSGLLVKQDDLQDARRFIYRLGPASHDLFHYIVTLAHWVQEHHLKGAHSVRLTHRERGHAYRPLVVCDHCLQPLLAREVRFEFA